MDKVITIAVNDLRIYFSQRGNLLGLTLMPLILAGVLGLTSTRTVSSYTLDIIDLDQSEQSAQFIEDVLASNELFVRSEETLTPEEARVRVAEEAVDAALIIPEGFAVDIGAFNEINILYYSNEDILGGVIQQSITTVVGRWNSTVIATRAGEVVVNALEVDVDTSEIYDRALNFTAQNPLQIDYVLSGNEPEAQPGEGFGQSVPGFGSMFVMFTVLGGMAVLLRERQNWTMQRIVIMPLARWQILGGKILTYFTLGMIQFTILFVFGFIMGLDIGGSWLAMLLVMVTYTLSITALAFALATAIRTEGQASYLTTLLGVSLAALGGAWWSLEVVPPFMQTIGHLSPVAWAMDAFTILIFYDGGLYDVLPNLVILSVIAAVLFMIAVRRFRYE